MSFGIDLRKWAGEGAFSPMRSIGSIDEMNAASGARDLPPVLVALLGGLERAYTTVESDLGEQRCSGLRVARVLILVFGY